MHSPIFFSLILALLTSANLFAEPIGFRETQVADASANRPLHVSIWYPTQALESSEATGTSTISVGENRAFIGVRAVPDAEPAQGAHSLVVLSHGYGGNWRNLNWLAAELAAQGYVVAAPDHPGTTTFDRRPAQAATLWERPHDLSRVIDFILAHPQLAGEINPDRIAAVGHSLGGWTVMALAGARFDQAHFAAECQAHPNPRVCGLSDELGLNTEGAAKTSLEASMLNHRVRAVVSLDLGLARGFTPASLAAAPIPVLIFGAGVDIGDLPARMESGYLVAHLPPAQTQYIEIADAAHFSFMQRCKPGAVEMLEEEVPGDGIICKDGDGRSREEIHQQVASQVIAFLEQAFAEKITAL
ncbi:predicted dienelactone hydrolase [Hahella chejuensis KCTC 2396]|uniref:Predicted dienelactone hydrolase n=1 Tax=Hahella chejuensis (strain KCTC 2396) TaxID=349521 RepID=Q2SHV0_HAHCH|nr:alpha/beta fold hydrolase [Hahella chejuensis]ABC29774.1 predicted dienelactone hydrolase [Hahella chejuensis KCTC 2396]